MAYSSTWVNKKNEILAIAQAVKDKYPDAFKLAGKRNADNSEVPGNDEYILRTAFEVNKVYVDAGNNGKRGNIHDISRDVLCFPNPAGARDASGRYLGLEIIDIINGAGGDNPSLGWNDVTQITMDSGNPGAWVQPKEYGGSVPPQPPQPSKCLLPPRDEQLGAFLAFDESYKEADRKNRCKQGAEPLYIDNEGIAVWLGVYIGHRQNGMSHAAAINQTREEMYAAGLPKP